MSENDHSVEEKKKAAELKLVVAQENLKAAEARLAEAEENVEKKTIRLEKLEIKTEKAEAKLEEAKQRLIHAHAEHKAFRVNRATIKNETGNKSLRGYNTLSISVITGVIAFLQYTNRPLTFELLIGFGLLILVVMLTPILVWRNDCHLTDVLDYAEAKYIAGKVEARSSTEEKKKLLFPKISEPKQSWVTKNSILLVAMTFSTGFTISAVSIVL